MIWVSHTHLQWDDIRWESVRDRSDILTQGIVFGASAPSGTSEVSYPPSLSREQAESSKPKQESPSYPSSARVSHSLRLSRISPALNKKKLAGKTQSAAEEDALMFLACFDAGFFSDFSRLSRKQSRGFAVQGLQMWDRKHLKFSTLEKMISYPQKEKQQQEEIIRFLLVFFLWSWMMSRKKSSDRKKGLRWRRRGRSPKVRFFLLISAASSYLWALQSWACLMGSVYSWGSVKMHLPHSFKSLPASAWQWN